MSRNKSPTLSNGLICNCQCKIKNCNYFIRCIEKHLLIEYSGEHAHAEEEEPYHKRGLTKEQKCVIDRCISMNIRGGKSIATEFITYNDDLLKNGKPTLEIPSYIVKLITTLIIPLISATSDEDKTICLYQAYKPENLSFQVHTLKYQNVIM